MATSTIGTGYEIQNNVENLEKGLAIVETGNTATQAITAGQFVYWKGTMYTASTAIASGTSYAVGTNLTACPNGGLNTLNENYMLLWTNSNPTANFAPQTVQLDLSGYRFVFIETYGLSSTICQIRKNSETYMGTSLMQYTSGVRSRSLHATNSGVTFDEGFQSLTIDNSVCRPLYIYGIK